MNLVLVVKNLPANVGDVRDVGLNPGSGRPPGEGHGNSSSILVWRIPWQGSLVVYSPWGLKESDTSEAT